MTRPLCPVMSACCARNPSPQRVNRLVDIHGFGAHLYRQRDLTHHVVRPEAVQ